MLSHDSQSGQDASLALGLVLPSKYIAIIKRGYCRVLRNLKIHYMGESKDKHPFVNGRMSP